MSKPDDPVTTTNTVKPGTKPQQYSHVECVSFDNIHLYNYKLYIIINNYNCKTIYLLYIFMIYICLPKLLMILSHL